MLQRIKIETFSKEFTRAERKTTITIDWTKIFYILQCVVLFVLLTGAVFLSVASNYLFIEEILYATFLIVLVLFVKVAGGRP